MVVRVLMAVLVLAIPSSTLMPSHVHVTSTSNGLPVSWTRQWLKVRMRKADRGWRWRWDWGWSLTMFVRRVVVFGMCVRCGSVSSNSRLQFAKLVRRHDNSLSA